VRQRIRTTYGYFAGGLGVTALAAMAASRATGLLRLMSTRPLLVRGGVAGAWVWGAPGCAVHEWMQCGGGVEDIVGVCGRQCWGCRRQCWGEKTRFGARTVLGVKRQCCRLGDSRMARTMRAWGVLWQCSCYLPQGVASPCIRMVLLQLMWDLLLFLPPAVNGGLPGGDGG